MATANRIVDVSAGVSQRPSREGVGRPSEPACILVADGDPLTLDLIEFKLTSRGYSVWTAADGEHDHQVLAALAVGAQDYLAKPFLPEQLVRRVGKLLANSGRSFA
jgi:CheY-like chemotaxis protein